FFFISVFLSWALDAKLTGNSLQAVTDGLDVSTDAVQLAGAFHYCFGILRYAGHMIGDFIESSALFVSSSSDLLIELTDLLNVLQYLTKYFTEFGGSRDDIVGTRDAGFHLMHRF